MASWLTSWIPQLPSIGLTLPSGIQTRFISFILKKSLGHFFKPGQLDINQIDPQIGSGYVQLSELALDEKTLNSHLEGLPIELLEGSVGRVTAHIPWPNPLTSVIGFAVDSLHLTLRLLPPADHPVHPIQSLSDSVISVAETFVHDELTSREEATLRESIYSDLAASLHEAEGPSLPGGLDPFISEHEDTFRSDNDPSGVTVFATLIESFLARFKFDATNLRLSIHHPQHAEFVLEIDEVRYTTETRDAINGAPADGGQSRTVSISGVRVSLRPLRPTRRFEYSASPQNSRTPTRSPSPASSTSSDEDAQFAMSQSLAFLPPQPPSLASSVSSSMYQSAISERPISPQERERSVFYPESQSRHNMNDTDIPSQLAPFLHLGTTPLTLELTTPSVVPEDEHQDGTRPRGRPHLQVTMGVIALVLRSAHVTAILDVVDLLGGHKKHDTSSPPSNARSLPLDFGLSLRGFVGLLTPFNVDQQQDPGLTSFFAKPLVPPKIATGYLRLYVELLDSTFGLCPTTTKESLEATVSIKDISLFSFQQEESLDEFRVSPILLSDPNLPSQYPAPHIQPSPDTTTPFTCNPHVFSVIDWTSRNPSQHGDRSRLTTWRTKIKQAQSKLEGSIQKHSLDDVGKPLIRASYRQSSPSSTLKMEVAPIHCFLDAAQLLAPHVLSFLDELMGHRNKQAAVPVAATEDSEVTPPATPRPMMTQRQMQEDMILSDLGLGLDYGFRTAQPTSKSSTHQRTSTTRSKGAVEGTLDARVELTMVRLQLRVPPPSKRTPRSGAIVIDFHSVALTSSPLGAPTQVRFHEQPPSIKEVDSKHLGTISCARIHVAVAPAGQHTTSTLVSLGPLSPNETDNPHHYPPILPRVTLSQIPQLSSMRPRTVLSVLAPSFYSCLTKDAMDSLQYWADDASQFMEFTFGSKVGDDATEKGDSREGSMIGSRYFTQSRTASTNASTSDVEAGTETVIKVSVNEAFVRILLPREKDGDARPFELLALDTDLLLELKPEGKQETVITLGIMDLVVNDNQVDGVARELLALTSPRSLSANPKPLIKLRFVSLIVPETIAKESRIKLTLWGFTFNGTHDVIWTSDLGLFFKAPPGAFEAVIPSERTVVNLAITDGSIRMIATNHPGSVVVHIGDMTFKTSLEGASPNTDFHVAVAALSLLAHENLAESEMSALAINDGVALWKKSGFTIISEIEDLDLLLVRSLNRAPGLNVLVDGISFKLHLCADTMGCVTAFMQDFLAPFNEGKESPPPIVHEPSVISPPPDNLQMMSSIDDLKFARAPDVGPAPDMILDDLPTNLDYLDESFGAAAGIQELAEDDEFSVSDAYIVRTDQDGVVSQVGGETIRILRPEGIQVLENYFDDVVPEAEQSTDLSQTTVRVAISKADVNVFLYDGYDWERTRRTIREETKEMRRKLARIRQLVASGQVQDPSIEDTSALLFNSLYIGLGQDADQLEPDDLIAAIDEELKDDTDITSQSSWQSLHPVNAAKTQSGTSHGPRRRLNRSKTPSMEFRLSGMEVEFLQYLPDQDLVSCVNATVRDAEILDRIRTSTWDKFLTDLRADSKGNIRETDSNMVKFELKTLKPVRGLDSEEARLKAKLLPLRLYVDQDALDFLKKFFSFKDPGMMEATSTDPGSKKEIYFQHAEVFPIDLKLDYKPRRVDYRALREGRTIELMNFFHFDGAEMTLRHITLAGITGWARLGDLLNDLWTPDVKATQLMEVISGVAPIRSFVNVGSGIADLVLLPIAQYKKDGRVVRGVQKGTTAFVRSTATEAIRLGARLATGTQVILEQAEGVLGRQTGWDGILTTETLAGGGGMDEFANLIMPIGGNDDDDETNPISKYAEQPLDIREGVQTAYHSLRRNLNSAAQTILAVPMEVYERSGNEGAVRSVIRAVPIAVLKPMIGASEAVSKTLLGLQNTMDPAARMENAVKYKHRV